MLLVLNYVQAYIVHSLFNLQEIPTKGHPPIILTVFLNGHKWYAVLFVWYSTIEGHFQYEASSCECVCTVYQHTTDLLISSVMSFKKFSIDYCNKIK